MFISPEIAIKEGWITGITDSSTQIQPNAIDFTLDRLYLIDESTIFRINEEDKKMRSRTEIFPDSEGYWLLDNHSVYDGLSAMYVEIPEGVACELIIRSTFSRNGIFLTSGLYDSKYHGHIGFALHNRSGEALIKQGTRIGQIKFIESDSVGVYSGGYNHKEGTHYTD